MLLLNKIRHWREKWDPKAPLVFAKRLRIGDDPNKPYVFPGDPVTDEHRQRLGLHRLRIWWNAKVIRLAEPPARKPRVTAQVELQPLNPKPKKKRKKRRVARKKVVRKPKKENTDGGNAPARNADSE